MLVPAPSPPEPLLPAPVSSWRLLRVWLLVGLQSFGGGVATMTLIRQAVVEQQKWATEDEFNRDWALCQMTPGINLLALTILMGRRVAGQRGIALSLLGLLLPTVTATILLTIGYARIRDSRLVQSALHTVIPATVGLGLYTAFTMGRPLLIAAHSEGRGSLLFALALLAGSAGAALTGKVPVALILAGAGAISAVQEWRRAAAAAAAIRKTGAGAAE